MLLNFQKILHLMRILKALQKYNFMNKIILIFFYNAITLLLKYYFTLIRKTCWIKSAGGYKFIQEQTKTF